MSPKSNVCMYVWFIDGNDIAEDLLYSTAGVVRSP